MSMKHYLAVCVTWLFYLQKNKKIMFTGTSVLVATENIRPTIFSTALAMSQEVPKAE